MALTCLCRFHAVAYFVLRCKTLWYRINDKCNILSDNLWGFYQRKLERKNSPVCALCQVIIAYNYQHDVELFL